MSMLNRYKNDMGDESPADHATTVNAVLPFNVNLRNTHQVRRDAAPDARPGDIQIESFRRSCARGDALGLVLHLIEQAGLTVEHVQAGQHLLARARLEAHALVASGRPPSSWTPAEREIVARLGDGNEAPGPLVERTVP